MTKTAALHCGSCLRVTSTHDVLLSHRWSRVCACMSHRSLSQRELDICSSIGTLQSITGTILCKRDPYGPRRVLFRPRLSTASLLRRTLCAWAVGNESVIAVPQRHRLECDANPFPTSHICHRTGTLWECNERRLLPDCATASVLLTIRPLEELCLPK